MSSAARAIIFDCDGVLVDSEPIANRVMASLLTEHGYPMTPEESVARFVGKTLQNEIDMFLAEGRPDLAEVIRTQLVPRTLAAFERDLKPVNGIPELVSRLGDTPRAVASGSTPERISLSLRVTRLAHLFEPHVYSSTLVPHPKPAPDVFLYAAANLGVAPAACTVIEDSVSGVTGAVAAGMRVIGFTAGSHATPELAPRLTAAGAHFIAQHADELRAHLRARGHR